MNWVRILIVSGDPLARAGLATLLGDAPGLQIAGRISGSDDLARTLTTYEPDVILWDMGWQPEAALARLAEEPLAKPVVVLVNDEADASGAWQAGAQGVLRRDAPPDGIATCLFAISQGMIVVDAEYRAVLADRVAPSVGAPQYPAAEPPLTEELTPRELEVLRLLAEGLPNKTIAQRLDISEHTVKFHVNALLGKLDVGSRTEAVVRATRLGLIFL